MKYYFLLVAIPLLISGCNNKEHQEKIQNLNKENQLLKDSLKTLKDSLSFAGKELQAYRESPEKLCANIKEFREAGDTAKLVAIYSKLQKYHPESEKTLEVSALIEDMKQETKKKIEKERKLRLSAVSKLKKRHDDVQGITWYYNPYFTHYDNSTRTSIYIGKSESVVWLRLKMSYGGEDWIFFDRAYLSYDGNTKSIIFDEYNEKHSDNDAYGVGEWIDIQVDKDMLQFLKEMVNGKKIKMQLIGKYGETRSLSSSEINGIRDVLLAYDVLKEEKDITALDDLFDK